MNHHLTLVVTFAGLLSTGLLAQDQIAVLEGAQQGSLQLRTFAEGATASKVVLDKLATLPIEVTNRIDQHALDGTRARRLMRHGLARVELAGGGRLFAYSRDGGRFFGFLQIDAAGKPAVVLELAAVNGATPFTDRVGVSANGSFAAIALKSGALYLARLDGKLFPNNARARKLTFKDAVEPFSPTVGKISLFFVTGNDRIWRCPLDDKSQPTDVTPSGQNSWRLKDELAISGDGKSVVFLFGAKDSMFLWLIGDTGAASRLAPKAAKYEEPGYLPEAVGGPRMMLNHDGSRLLYTDSTVRDEIHIMDTANKVAPLQITNDANFKPYIGTGIIPSFIKQTVAIAVGDPGALDYYTAAAGAKNVTNITATAKETKPPFGTGAIPVASGHELVEGVLLTSEKFKNGAQQARLVEIAAKRSTVVTAGLAGAMERYSALSGTPTVRVPSLAGDQFLDGKTGKRVLAAPPGISLTPEIQTAGFTVFLAGDANGNQRIVARILAGPLLLFPVEKGLQQLSATRSGGGVVNGATLRYLTLTRQVTMDSGTPPKIRIVVSGVGG